MQHEKLNTVEKRLAIYRELREGFEKRKQIQFQKGVCIAMFYTHGINVYACESFNNNLPELYKYKYTLFGVYYWLTPEDRLAALDKAIADCEKKLKNK